MYASCLTTWQKICQRKEGGETRGRGDMVGGCVIMGIFRGRGTVCRCGAGSGFLIVCRCGAGSVDVVLVDVVLVV